MTTLDKLSDGKQWVENPDATWTNFGNQDFFQHPYKTARINDSTALIVWAVPTSSPGGAPSGTSLKARTIAISPSMAMGPVTTLWTDSGLRSPDYMNQMLVSNLDGTYAVVNFSMGSTTNNDSTTLMSISGSTITVLDHVVTYTGTTGQRHDYPGVQVVPIHGTNDYIWTYSESGVNNPYKNYQRVTYGPSGLTFHTPVTIDRYVNRGGYPTYTLWPYVVSCPQDGSVWWMEAHNSYASVMRQMVLTGTNDPSYLAAPIELPLSNMSNFYYNQFQNSNSSWGTTNDPNVSYGFGFRGPSLINGGSSDTSSTFGFGVGKFVYSGGSWTVEYEHLDWPMWPGVTNAPRVGGFHNNSYEVGLYITHYINGDYPMCLSVANNGQVSFSAPIELPSALSNVTDGNPPFIMSNFFKSSGQNHALYDYAADDGISVFPTTDFGMQTTKPYGTSGYRGDANDFIDTACVAGTQGSLLFWTHNTNYKDGTSTGQWIDRSFVHFFGKGEVPPLRLRNRDDNLGTHPSPRIKTVGQRNTPSSLQGGVKRVGSRNTWW